MQIQMSYFRKTLHSSSWVLAEQRLGVLMSGHSGQISDDSHDACSAKVLPPRLDSMFWLKFPYYRYFQNFPWHTWSVNSRPTASLEVRCFYMSSSLKLFKLVPKYSFLTSDKQNLLACLLQSWYQHSTPVRMQKYPESKASSGVLYVMCNRLKSPAPPVSTRKTFVSMPLLLLLLPIHLCVEFPVFDERKLETKMYIGLTGKSLYFSHLKDNNSGTKWSTLTQLVELSLLIILLGLLITFPVITVF